MSTHKRVSPHKRLLAQARPLYDQLLAAQGGVCAICGNPPKTRRLDIDHDHKTLQIRGLLCHRCNRALPTHVTAEWMRKAIAYLEREPINLDNLNQTAIARGAA